MFRLDVHPQVQCPGCGHVAKFKLGKTHHSGNNKRGIGTFDKDTQAATGAFYVVSE